MSRPLLGLILLNEEVCMYIHGISICMAKGYKVSSWVSLILLNEEVCTCLYIHAHDMHVISMCMAEDYNLHVILCSSLKVNC